MECRRSDWGEVSGNINTYMESRKMVLMSLFAGQQWRRKHREETCVYRGGTEREVELEE